MFCVAEVQVRKGMRVVTVGAVVAIGAVDTNDTIGTVVIIRVIAVSSSVVWILLLIGSLQIRVIQILL